VVPVSDAGGGGGGGAAGAAAAAAATTGEPAPPAAPRATAASMPTMIASGEPQVFGRYTVFHRLGEGGMCELFIAGLAGPEGFQRTLVLKRLKPEIARNRAAVDQFIDEAKLGSTLVHSNIVPVFDFGKVGDGYFIAQEYVVGRNVGQLVERHLERLREPLEPGIVYYIAHEALHALAYAHDKTNEDGQPLHLIHRDVSPGNILVSARGEVKLIDFGIAKAEGRVSHTDLGNVKGNAAYMAPEQARGLALDARADLFSLGLVMYHALTGQPLYRGTTLAEIFYAAASGPTAEQLADLERLPPIAAKVLARALAPDPADRYASADEFAADLLHHVAPGVRATVATLLNALFGPELRPLSGGAGSGGGLGTSGLRRKAG
jgi:serine/threonine protein kinase